MMLTTMVPTTNPDFSDNVPQTHTIAIDMGIKNKEKIT